MLYTLRCPHCARTLEIETQGSPPEQFCMICNEKMLLPDEQPMLAQTQERAILAELTASGRSRNRIYFLLFGLIPLFLVVVWFFAFGKVIDFFEWLGMPRDWAPILEPLGYVILIALFWPLSYFWKRFEDSENKW
ncbi:hypothetical protein L6R29_21250 [Myxococcota bacterium]|nr:hypothetical protein [Myxococcota bacterium]